MKNQIRYTFMEMQYLCIYEETSKHCYNVIRVWELPLKALPINSRLVTDHIELLIHQRIITTLLIAQRKFSLNEICKLLEESTTPKSVIEEINDEYSDDYTSSEE